MRPGPDFTYVSATASNGLPVIWFRPVGA